MFKQPRSTWLKTTGSYCCDLNTCHYCDKHTKRSTIVSRSTEKKYPICDYINCSSSYVVYVVKCTSCPLQYGGGTIRSLGTRIAENYNEASNPNAKDISNVFWHFKEIHSAKMNSFKFSRVEKIKKPTQWRDMYHHLLEREVKWIFILQTRIPPAS